MTGDSFFLLQNHRAAWPSPSAEAHAQAMLRARVLREVSAALEAAGETALLVKGAALALSVYPTAASRPMRDVDLLVRPERERAVVAALVSGGLVEHAPASRPKSRRLLGETQLMAHVGALTVLVEVHTSLDKVVSRPLDVGGIEARATTAASAINPELRALRIPSMEDHALLVAQHLAAHEMRHSIGFLDLELLLRQPLDRHVLIARAYQSKLQTVMFIALSTLRALGAATVDAQLIAAFDPGSARRAALWPFYDLGRFPVARGPGALGWRWIAGQTPLRDDIGAWMTGLLRYARLRAEDRFSSR